MPLFSPVAFVVVVLELARLKVAHDGIGPTRKVDTQAGYCGVEELGGGVFGRFELEAIASCPYGLLIAYFGFDFDDVAQWWWSPVGSW